MLAGQVDFGTVELASGGAVEIEFAWSWRGPCGLDLVEFALPLICRPLGVPTKPFPPSSLEVLVRTCPGTGIVTFLVVAVLRVVVEGPWVALGVRRDRLA